MHGLEHNKDIAGFVWNTRYRFRRQGMTIDSTIEDTWQRVARTLAAVEYADMALWQRRFYQLMQGFQFVPGGRILAGAGTGQDVTLFNCFVMGDIEDSDEGISRALSEGALTLQQGGGVGYDFSPLRPASCNTDTGRTDTAGPVSCMHTWDRMCESHFSSEVRHAAIMATLRCDHPDIEEFIEAKRKPGKLSHFNLSVLVTDAFMRVVRSDGDWLLVFPVSTYDPADGEIVQRRLPGQHHAQPCRVVRKVRARELWYKIMQSAYDCAEPGVLFIDRITLEDNLVYRERISATNPCGEIPLPSYGACDLGSLNLTKFVLAPFTQSADIDWPALSRCVPVAVRLLDNVIDASRFPLAQQQQQAKGSRRIGLGIMGLADALAMLGINYGSPQARLMASSILQAICHAAYDASIDLAREKGPFPYLDTTAYLDSPFIQRLPQQMRERIRRHGIRNSHLIAIAPTGSISLLAGNVSSGIEPIYALLSGRWLNQPDSSRRKMQVEDYAYRLWRIRQSGDVPDNFVIARDLSPGQHLLMQAALQPFVDNAISKTINVATDYPFEEFCAVYQQAHELGLKGCTTYRSNPVTREVLVDEYQACATCRSGS